MNQSSWLTRKLAQAQENYRAAKHVRVETAPSVRYSIYTEFFTNLLDLTARYFDGATLYFGTGLYEGNTESTGVIEIVGTAADLQSVVFLAGDIKSVNRQASVLIVSAPVTAVSV